MSLKQTILDDFKTAMKAGDRTRLDTLRLLRSSLQNRELELRAKHGRDYQIDDDEVLAVVSRAAKQRRESIESYRQGGRDDLAAKEEAELTLLGAYLPKALTEDDLRAVIREAIADAGATSPRDMGKVMRLVMPRLTGRADGKVVNQLVQELLKG